MNKIGLKRGEDWHSTPIGKSFTLLFVVTRIMLWMTGSAGSVGEIGMIMPLAYRVNILH